MAASPIPLEALRRRLDARWTPSSRVVNIYSAAGALLGLVSLGAPPVWFLLFPPAMAVVTRLTVRWGWLSHAFGKEKPHSGLRFLYLAPLSVLFFYPFSYVWLIFLAFISTPLVIAISGLRGGVPARDQEDLATTSATFLLFGLSALAYCGLQALALRRFTGRWHASLFVRLVAWTCALGAVDAFLVKQLWTAVAGFPLASLVVAGWIVAIVVLFQSGKVFGLWLTRPNPTREGRKSMNP